MSISKLVVTGAVTAATATAVGAGTVSAASTTSSNNTNMAMRHDMPAHPKDGGKPVTDKTVIAKVKAAVQAKYPKFTVDHVVKLPNGSYLALSRNASGNRVIVSISSNYAVTGTKKVPAHMGDHDGKPPMAMRMHGPPHDNDDASS